MSEPTYYAPTAELPPQEALITDRAVVTEAYTVIPRGVLREIVVSHLPGWENTRAWVLARPVEGFSTTFAQCLVEVGERGGSDHPEDEEGVESLVFVLEGTMSLRLDGEEHELTPGGFAFVPPGAAWAVRNHDEALLKFQWIRKEYDVLPGLEPKAVVGNERDLPVSPMPNTDDFWATNLIPVGDLAYDMHVNIVTFNPGAVIPFAETHIMEHGIYVLQGKGVYQLNQDWVEVEAGDFLWLRAFCPQACYAGGPTRFRYLLYKDVNRQVRLTGR